MRPGEDEPPPLVVRSYADARRVLMEQATFTTAGRAIDCGQRRPLLPLQADGADQARSRAVLDGWLEGAGDREAAVRVRARALVGALDPEQPEDLGAAVCRPLPALVLADLLDLPAGEADQLWALHDAVVASRVAGEAHADRLPLGDRIEAYFAPLVEARRGEPGDDLIRRAWAAEDGDRPGAAGEITGLCHLALFVALATVTDALRAVLRVVVADPGRWAELREQPDRFRIAVEEVLRWDTPVPGLTRVATGAAVLEAGSVEAGTPVVVMLPEANRDSAAFAAAEALDLDRRPNPHLAFGAGRHRCVGAAFAHVQIRVVVEELLDAWPHVRRRGDDGLEVWLREAVSR